MINDYERIIGSCKICGHCFEYGELDEEGICPYCREENENENYTINEKEK